MASIFRKRGQLWARIKDSTGRWTNRPTGFAIGDEQEAARVALEMQRAIKMPAPTYGRLDRSKQHHLYLIASSCGAVKIGRAHDCAKRLRALQASCPPSITLTLIAVAEGCGHVEIYVHEALGEYRKHGEWFSAEIGERIQTALRTMSFSDYVRQLCSVTLPVLRAAVA